MGGFVNIKVSPWTRAIITRAAALGPAVIVALVAGTKANSGIINKINSWLNILQSVILPFAVLPVLRMARSTEIMGEFALTPFVSALWWLSVVVLIGINVYLVITAIYGGNDLVSGDTAAGKTVGVVFFVCYFYAISEVR